MFLSDRTIKRLVSSGDLLIEPYDEANVQSCSYDVTIADIALPQPLQFDACIWGIAPGQFVLGVTRERIKLPSYLAATVSGKSTWGRRGLAIHITAGHCDPGFDGTITLEIVNHSAEVIPVRQGTPIAQLVFSYLDEPAEHPYAGRYQFQRGVVGARPSLEFLHGFVSPPSLSRQELEQRLLMGPHVHKGGCDYPERGCICEDMWTAHDNGVLCSYIHCMRCSMLAIDADKLA